MGTPLPGGVDGLVSISLCNENLITKVRVEEVNGGLQRKEGTHLLPMGMTSRRRGTVLGRTRLVHCLT